MQDQGKRLLIAVAAALAFMLLWNVIFPSKPDDQKPTTGSNAGSGSQVVKSTPGVKPGESPTGTIGTSPTPTPTAGSGSAQSTDPAAPTGQGAPQATPAVEATRGPEKTVPLKFPNVEATFSNYGGTLVGWKLTDPRYVHDETNGQLIPQYPDTGAFQVNYRLRDGYGKALIPPQAEWEQIDCGKQNAVCYRYTSPTIDVTKRFTVYPTDYMVKMVLEVTPKTADIFRPVITSWGYQNPKTDSESGNGRVQPRTWQSATLKQSGTIASTTDLEIQKEGPRVETSLQWTGFEHPYLLVAFAPHRTSEAETIEKHTRAISNSDMTPKAPAGLMSTELWLGPVTFESGSKAGDREIVAYLGPKNYEQLDRADEVAGFTTGFKETIDFGHFPLLGFSLSFIGKPLLWLLAKFYSVVGNWGIAIILLTFCVKLATLYWTTKSMRSMKAMAAVAPQMKVIQAKHKDDRQRQQAETMALYKQHNVNPLAGCLPIFLQIPIWSALYIMLSATGELYLEPFVPGWINDLTDTDPLHILPVLLVVTMFAQARLTPSASTDRSQKMIQYGMPLMFGVMSFFFPSGLTLYIFTNTVLSALHGIYMNKYDKKSMALTAQLKKNAADAAAAKAGVAPAPSKPAPGKPAKAAKVIDVEEAKSSKVDEVTEDSGDGGGDDDEDEAAAPVAAAATASPARARRRKKRRR